MDNVAKYSLNPADIKHAGVRLILTLVVSATMVAAIGARRPDDANELGGRHSRYWVLKRRWRECGDMVIVGDSRVYRAISPSEMRKILGQRLRIFNYGFSAVGFSKEYLLAAEQVLDPSSASQSIVLGITPHSLTPRSIRDNGFLQATRDDLVKSVALPYVANLEAFFAPMHPRSFVASVFGWKESVTKDTEYYQDYRKDGWVPSTRVPEDRIAGVRAYSSVFEGNRVSGDIVSSALAAVTRWRQKGIAVYGFRVPTSERVVAIEDELSGFDERDFVDRFANAGGQWIEVGQKDYHSYDGSHLHSNEVVKSGDAPGRIYEWDAGKLSRDLAAAILTRVADGMAK